MDRRWFAEAQERHPVARRDLYRRGVTEDARPRAGLGWGIGTLILCVAVTAGCTPNPRDVVSLDLRVQADKATCWEVSTPTFSYTPGALSQGTSPQTGCGHQTLGWDDDYVATPSSVIIRITKGDRLEARLIANGEVLDETTLHKEGTVDVLSQ